MASIVHFIANMRNRYYLALDILAMLVIPTIALAIRLDTGYSWEVYGKSLLVYTLLALAVKLAVYVPLGMYNHLWRYASIEEVTVILTSVFSAGLIFILIYLFAIPFFPSIPARIPRSVPVVDLLLSLVIHGGIRLSGRLFATELKKRNSDFPVKQRVLIVGAGNSGTMIAKELLRNPAAGMVPVGFVDDDPRKQDALLFGLPVLGGRDIIPEMAKKLKVTLILIAIPSASGKALRSIMRIIEPLKIPIKTLPGVSELFTDTVDLQQFREMRIDDLLRREPVKTDIVPVRRMLEGESVLITGAGGSIGSEIARHVAQCSPSVLYLLGHGENSIHDIQRELAKKFPRCPAVTLIADIRDEERIRQLFALHRPAFVYHAAAHKHVPLMEDNIVDALTNNVLGSMLLLKYARKYGTKNFTLISTDKAVQARSIMGVTKRMAELALQLCANGSSLNYSAVRFGNVLGSRGSVVPLFMEQIAGGGPVNITHPDMRRYFMTIPEAVHLVLLSSTLQGSGEIYVLDMGEPERILDLAIDLIELSGRIPYKDINIAFTGLRPGEKLFEELFREGEVFVKSKHEKIFAVIDPFVNHNHAASHAKGNGNGSPPRPKRRFRTFEEYEHFIRKELLAIDHTDRPALLHIIQEVVPEFQVWEASTDGVADAEAQDTGAVTPARSES